jgi:trk system potassium uptake protein TrkH
VTVTATSSRRRLGVVVSAVVGACGVAMVPAVVTGTIYAEWADTWALAAGATLAGAVGLAGRHYAGTPGRFTTREGFAAVALSWLALIGFGAVPYLITGAVGSPIDSLFETTAGFTTTGASVLPDPGLLSHAMLIWRATSQWIGGMGIIVLSIAILPMLGAGGVELARAEAPGPEPDRVTPRFRDTAKRLWWIYVGMTIVEFVLLVPGDMGVFQAAAHALTTMPTGGFGTEAGSLGGFSPYTQWVVIVFMLTAAISFALHFRALRRPRAYLESREFLGFFSIIGIAVLVVLLGTWSLGSGVEARVRDAAFTAVTMVTGTGYATVNWAAWAPGLLAGLLVMMFLGGMAGSTASGIKTYRLGILYKTIGSSLKRVFYPRVVSVQRFGARSVEPRIVQGVVAFFVLYVGFFVAGAVVLGFMEPSLDLVSVGSASASAISNVGPALGAVGPASSYATLGADSKAVLSFLMLVGRLEIFPVVILLTHRWWRR